MGTFASRLTPQLNHHFLKHPYSPRFYFVFPPFSIVFHRFHRFHSPSELVNAVAVGLQPCTFFCRGSVPHWWVLVPRLWTLQGCFSHWCQCASIDMAIETYMMLCSALTACVSRCTQTAQTAPASEQREVLFLSFSVPLPLFSAARGVEPCTLICDFVDSLPPFSCFELPLALPLAPLLKRTKEEYAVCAPALSLCP